MINLIKQLSTKILSGSFSKRELVLTYYYWKLEKREDRLKKQKVTKPVRLNSYNSEFGYELIATIPYAYWLFKNGLLKGTISGKDTQCFYYFSPCHEINPEQRSGSIGKVKKVDLMYKAGIPNCYIHKPYLNLEKWEAPPYKKIYSNDWAKFEKPTFVVYNRYNNEWPGKINKPINYFSLDFLAELFSILNRNYQVLYCNIEGQKDLYDNSPPLFLNDYNLCKEQKVTHIKDLLTKHPELTYNQIQLYYFSNCENFLTMNGGGGILASYFGGRNIIYTKFCTELQRGDYGYYHLLGNSKIMVVKTYDEIRKILY